MFKRTKVAPADDAKLQFEYAKLAVAEFGAWIKNADTKVTVIAASLGVIVTLVATRSHALARIIFGDDVALRITATVSATVFLIAVVGTFISILVALVPRTGAPGPRNPFAWPSVANFTGPDDEAFTTASVNLAWAQAFALSRITRAKYAAFTSALRCFIVVIVSAAFIVAMLSAL